MEGRSMGSEHESAFTVRKRMMKLITPGKPAGTLAVLLAIAMAVACAVCLLSSTPLIRNMELKTLDYRFLLRGKAVPVSPAIKIIAVDEKSLQKMDIPFFLWPSLIAEISEKLVRGGAKVIGIDLIQEKSIEKYKPGQMKRMQKALLSGKIVLISVMEIDGTIRYPHQALRAVAGEERMALSNLSPDSDDVMRRQVFYLDDREGAHIPCFPFVIASLHSGGILCQGADHRYRIGDRIIPDEHGHMAVNYAGPAGTFESISFCDVLAMAEDSRFSARFKDAVVLIGCTDLSSKDFCAVPFTAGSGKMMSGIEVHANTINTVLQGAFLRPEGKVEGLAVLFLICITAALISYHMKPVWGVPLTALICAAAAGISFFLFSRSGIVTALVTPCLAVPLSYGSAFLYRYMTVDRKVREIRGIFGKMVSPAVEEELWKEHMSVRPGEGEEKEVTVLFSDINGFSDICDSSSAAEVMEMLNEYFHKMVDIVLNNRGTIKQFVGDEIMAMYGTPGSDPDQAFLAIKTAVEMIDTLQEMKRNQGSTHRGFYETKIGIHTGMMKVGFIGSQRRMEYAAVGRDVNLAARLEALNKNLDPGPLTEESVFDWEALMDRLHRRDTEGLKRVCEMLNGASRKLIDTRAPGKEPGEGEKKTLLEGLNELLSNPDFYDQKTFSTVEISQKGRYLLDRGMAQLSPQERMRLNRLLLEALCDNEIDPAGTSYILISDDTFERAKGALYLLDGVKHIRLASQKLKGFEEKKTVYKLWKKGWK